MFLRIGNWGCNSLMRRRWLSACDAKVESVYSYRRNSLGVDRGVCVARPKVYRKRKVRRSRAYVKIENRSLARRPSLSLGQAPLNFVQRSRLARMSRKNFAEKIFRWKIFRREFLLDWRFSIFTARDCKLFFAAKFRSRYAYRRSQSFDRSGNPCHVRIFATLRFLDAPGSDDRTKLAQRDDDI